ncbi:MAG TPA: 30S ribosomal protein S12 methylthiotransferase RimO [candidate division Zixibacteria bacterium]|nr:30S ribosomal protein S12 methylthiotransferase RimO [candidate division Zixibacteria bacterium]
MKFYIHKLGCPKNDVDADYIAARLIFEGHQPVKDPAEADSVVVNTCGFILPAKEESISELLRFGRLKQSGTLKTLYASGCLAQRNGDDLIREMPEIDGAFGLGALDSLAKAVTGSTHEEKAIRIEARKLGYLTWNNRFISDDFPYAYLKISDGCDRGCTYCAIPGMRGKFRSRPLDSILREAEYLANNGKKEIILVSQEATLYGYNYKGIEHPNIITLLRELEKIDGIEWIRIMYLYPAQLDDSVIKYLASGNKTLNYFDLPFQHVNSRILSDMRRRIDRDGINRLLDRIRKTSPDAAVRTTFIVGFPGETEAEFEELYDFVADHRFDRMGVFTYSAEEGTPAAEMPNQISEQVKQDRLDALMTLQQGIAFEENNRLIGSIHDVIIDAVNADGTGLGRSRADCPDVDQEVMVAGDKIQVGDMLRVKITAADGYDLKGAVLGE